MTIKYVVEKAGKYDLMSVEPMYGNKCKFVCSELGAYSLKHTESWEYRNKGILSRFTTRVNPFSDCTVNKMLSNADTTLENEKVI